MCVYVCVCGVWCVHVCVCVVCVGDGVDQDVPIPLGCPLCSVMFDHTKMVGGNRIHSFK